MKKGFLNKISFSLFFSIFLFLIFIITLLITGTIGFIAIKTGIIEAYSYNPVAIMLIVLIASLIIGTVITTISRPFTIKPFKKIVAAMERLSCGDFTVRLEGKGPHEMESVANSFNRMAEELASIEVLRTDFINNFSHEFKTPIVSIKGFAEILKYSYPTQEEKDEYLDIIISEASRLAELATNVLNLSKIETQSILTEKQVFNLGEQVRRCILLLDAKTEKKNIDLSVDIEDIMLKGNKEMLSQVWVNLFDNALKFTPENGEITVSAKKIGNEAVVMIKDNGCGINDEAIKHIFDKFYQADTSHATGGNGIGLTVVKKIVDLHEGEIECKSSVGRGTTFKVFLPLD